MIHHHLVSGLPVFTFSVDFGSFVVNGTSVSAYTVQSVALFEYIEQFYNNYNPHSANNGLTPNQKEENYFKKI